jgi:hypothetical protein
MSNINWDETSKIMKDLGHDVSDIIIDFTYSTDKIYCYKCDQTIILSRPKNGIVAANRFKSRRFPRYLNDFLKYDMKITCKELIIKDIIE